MIHAENARRGLRVDIMEQILSQREQVLKSIHDAQDVTEKGWLEEMNQSLGLAFSAADHSQWEEMVESLIRAGQCEVRAEIYRNKQKRGTI